MRERHKQGLLSSLYILKDKELLALAKDIVEAEKQINTQEEQDQAKAALTQLFSDSSRVSQFR